MENLLRFEEFILYIIERVIFKPEDWLVTCH